MSTNKPIKKKKTGFIGLLFLSLMLSFILLYCLAAGLWGLYGYEYALRFFVALLKANQVSVSGLNETIFSNPVLSTFIQKFAICFSDAALAEKAQTLTKAGVDGIKEGLSGYLSEDTITDAFVTGASFLNSAYLSILKAVFLFILALKIFFIKTFLLLAAIPLFALLGAVGLIDGLSEREIRRAELGRESSYLFHMLNQWILKIIGIGLCTWICIPVVVNPQWFFVPLGLLFSMMLSLSASKFKKYL